MIGIDTNVLVRYIAQDDASQSAQATELIEQVCSAQAPGFIGIVVLVELVWVSENCYGATRAEVAEIVRRILRIRQLVVQEAELVWKALRLFESGKADFSDCVIERTAHATGCTETMTFDQQAAATAGMTLLTG
ncbi:MAG: type II toxin-antitoxin system VapC family toxin [Thiohalocapsa sp.]|nr:type II toxin-antitoxin system VapC family toxin [Thiohalocapsa sp.]